MTRIYVPTANSDDWKSRLAQPERHWRTGYSAKTLAYCWQEAEGFPAEIKQLFVTSGIADFDDIELLFAFPEYQIPLPGGGHPSQNDLLVIAKAQNQLISITVEGKVSEPFGPPLGEWMLNASSGKRTRLACLVQQLGLTEPLPEKIRYQLLHRAVAAIIAARYICAKTAIMIIHAFGKTGSSFADYQQFLSLFAKTANLDQLVLIDKLQDINFYCGWAQGNHKYLEK